MQMRRGIRFSQAVVKYHSLKRHPNGKMQIKIKGEAGKPYILEARPVQIIDRGENGCGVGP